MFTLLLVMEMQWIEEVSGVKFPSGFADSLKDGIILCK